MHLKSLQITGFKTFADATTFEFPMGVVGIVGPNGSGKSNIADAILWALGEQSLKSLRGSVLTDVIFAGSQARKPTNMAEVVLTIDNADGQIGLDFTEVAVERRAFRTGDSEYCINKAKCRLRDIHDLFLDTGVGRSTYSIIGQNEVDRVLSARPEDRRALFEEAAGVSRYRTRRLEAMSKLDSTQANLNRINDILREVEQQIGPMAGQAEAAREHRVLAMQLRELSLGLYVLDHDRRIKENGKLEHEIFVLGADIERLGGQVATLETEEQGLRLALSEVEEAIDALRRENSQVTAALSSARADQRVRQERLRAAASDRERLAAEQARLAQRASEMPAELGALEAAAAALRDRMAELEASRTELEGGLRYATNRLQQAAEESQSKAKAAAEAAARQAEGQRTLASLREASAELARRSEAVAQELAVLRGRLEEAATGVARTKEQEQVVRDELAALEDERQAAQERQRHAAEALEARRRSGAELSEQLRSLESRLATLRELRDTHHGIARGAQMLLEARKSGALQGIIGTVAELVVVERPYQAAIAAALGDRAQYVVVADRSAAALALEHLRSTSGGRATLLPLDQVGSVDPVAQPASSVPAGALRCAVTVCRCDDAVRPAVQHLLGQVFIAESRDAAREALSASPRHIAVCTPDGECHFPDGSVTGGSEESPAEDPLARTTEIAELEVRVAEVTARRQQAQGEQEAADAERQEAEALLREIQSRSDALRSQQGRVAAELARLGAAAEALQRDESRLTQEAGDLLARREERSTRIASLEAELAAAPEIPAPDTDEVNRELAALAAQRDDWASQVSDNRAELAGAKERLESRKSELARLAEEMAHASDRSELLEREIRGLEDSAAENERVVAEQDGQIAELQGRADELHQALEERNQVRADLMAQLQQLSEVLKQARGAAPELQQRLQVAEVRRARNEATLATVVEHLATEYEMTVEEAAGQAPPIDNERRASEDARRLRLRLKELGDVNLGAIAEYDRLTQRRDFLSTQKADLDTARDNLRAIIAEIDEATRAQFMDTFHAVNAAFGEIFAKLFEEDEARANGRPRTERGVGRAELVLTDPENLLETGVEVIAQVPGKRLQNLLSLSGGERALTAISLLFAMLKVKPPPFCVLDEIDAPLDEVNTRRFADLLCELSGQTQFLVITHARATMEACDVLYGVTMQEQGVSRSLSVTLSQAESVAETGKT